MNNNNEVSEILNKNIYCSKTKPETMFSMPDAHYHNHYEIYYLLLGKRKYFIGNQIVTVNKGDIVFIPKGILHKTSNSDSKYHQRLLISFNDKMVYPEFEKEVSQCFGRYLYRVPPTLGNRLESILFKIEKEYKTNDKYSENLIKGYLFELICFLNRNSEKCSYEQAHTKADTRIQEIATYISENFEKDIRLEQVAKIFSISAEHLSRKFKKVTGFRFSEYLTLVRVMQAEKLLITEKIPITEIAISCGFNDSNYFSAVFKKTKGISPYKYRKSS